MYSRPIPKYEASAIVYKDGNRVIARDRDGKLIAKGKAGVDDAEVIQSAIDSLTPNRTWKETVYIAKGEYTIDKSIQIPSYTRLVNTGKFILPENSDYEIIINKHYKVGHDDHIEIVGGVYDGNNNTYANALALISIRGVVGDYYNRCIDIIVRDAYVMNIQGTGDNGVGVWVSASSDVLISRCIAENCKTGINVEGTYNYGSIIEKCICVNNYVGICSGLSHFMLVRDNKCISNSNNGISCDSPHEVKLINNYCSNNGNKGIAVFTSIGEVPINAMLIGNQSYDNSIGISITPSPKCKIIGNEVYNNSKYGIYISGGCSKSIISNNVSSNNGMDGIYLYDAHNCVISSNVCMNNGQSGSGYSGIILKEYANGCVIIGNRCLDDQSTKTQDYGITIAGTCTLDIVKSNIVLGNKTSGLNITTSGNVYVFGNLGYTTENHGTATINADGTTTTFTIPHGLVSTPNYVNVIPKAGAPMPNSIDADSTNITLTFSTAPASGTYYYWWEARI